MNADSFRQFYDYHFSINREIWDAYVMSLPQELFTQNSDYSIGSARNQIVHLINVDNAWFSELRGIDDFDELDAATDDKQLIRAHWDTVERDMRAYLASLRDDMLMEKPISEPEEDRDLVLWQVLLHVVNHGTDHRAQLLRLLNDLGVKTGPQDYIFYVFDHLN